MINIIKTLLNSYCEWVWYNVSKNTSIAPKVVLPRSIPDDDNSKYHLMYQSQQFNQMCLMKFNELFLPEDYITGQKNDLEKTMFPYYILIVSLGLLGNFLSTCVFFGTKLRYSSPSVYLGALALSDNCYLITTIARRSFNLNNLFFKTFSGFLINFCACLSAWLVVVLTVERYIIAIKWPHLSKSFCTVARAKIMIIILTILTFLVNILEFLFVNKRVGLAIYKICQTVIVNIAPLIMIGILNILITYNIYKSSRNRRNLTANSITSNENLNDRNWISQTTIFLVLFAFMCSNMPYCITKTSFDVFRVYEVTNNCIKNTNEVNVHTSVFYTLATMRRKQALKKLICWGVITIHIYYTSFCINFLLYCVSGKNFRKELVDVFKKSGNQLQNFYISITNR